MHFCQTTQDDDLAIRTGSNMPLVLSPSLSAAAAVKDCVTGRVAAYRSLEYRPTITFLDCPISRQVQFLFLCSLGLLAKSTFEREKGVSAEGFRASTDHKWGRKLSRPE